MAAAAEAEVAIADVERAESLLQQVPGLLKGVVLGALGAGIEADVALPHDRVGGDDVPKVKLNDVGRDVIDLIMRVRSMVGEHVASVTCIFDFEQG